MIVTERLVIDGREFTRNYSDAGRYVVRDGISYEEALDPAEFGRVYTEGELIRIDNPTDEDFIEAGKVLMGYEAEG